MKSKVLAILSLALITGFSSIFAQGFTPPAEGKAVIYFTRVTGYGGATSFEFFHQDKFIGIFKGKNYMRYECEPGEQLLWASSENKEFITSELEEGKSYIVKVDVIMGAWKAHVGLTPIAEDHEDFERAKKLILSKASVVTPESKIKNTSEKLKDFIPEQLERYENVWKDERNYKHISPDMALSEEAMK